jgi:hypothetical protein
MSALAVYLAKPLGDLSLTNAHRQSLATVLRRGDVLLSAGNTRCAELVKRLTRSAWSHVSMYVGPLDDAVDPRCVVEADLARGVRAIRLSELDAHRIRVLRPVGLDDIERGRLTESVLRHIGSKYGVAHAWQLACTLPLRRRRARLQSLSTTMGRNATSFICSTLIAQAFALIDRPILAERASVCEAEKSFNWLVPADFERASFFAIVCQVNANES